jgi:hypothetical protein
MPAIPKGLVFLQARNVVRVLYQAAGTWGYPTSFLTDIQAE